MPVCSPSLFDALVEVAANFYDITLLELLGRTRRQPAATARLMVYYVASMRYGLDARTIARAMDRNYATVTRGIESASGLKEVERLSALLQHRANERLGMV